MIRQRRTRRLNDIELGFGEWILAAEMTTVAKHSSKAPVVKDIIIAYMGQYAL